MSNTVVGRNRGRFQLGRELGRGSFGVVYLATDEQGVEYAVKLIGPHDDREAKETFEREIQAATSIDDEHVLKVHDFGLHTDERGAGYLFTVTDYCPEGNYRQVLQGYAASPMEPNSIVADFAQILGGLEALHRRIIHRDVKPENILKRGSVLKVGDFGLSKFVDEATRTFSFKGGGSPRYMAPEVWEMQRAFPATDLYAVGVMLFEALTLMPPFGAGDINALRDLHRFRPPPRVKSIRPEISDRLDGIVNKLLQKDPTQRYQSAREVIDALNVIQPTSEGTDASDIVRRVREQYDAAQDKQLKGRQRVDIARADRERNQYKEEEVIGLFEDVIAEINRRLEETKINARRKGPTLSITFNHRSLHIEFFRPGELYEGLAAPGRKDILRRRSVVHGGYIEIREGGEARERWNIVLLRPPGSMYGDWILIETDLRTLEARIKPFELMPSDRLEWTEQQRAEYLQLPWISRRLVDLLLRFPRLVGWVVRREMKKHDRADQEYDARLFKESDSPAIRNVQKRLRANRQRDQRREQVQILAHNLAYHWHPTVHTSQLRDKQLERSDVLRIVRKLIS